MPGLKLRNISIYLLISNLYSLGMEATFSNNQNMCRPLLAFSTSFLIRQYSKKRMPVPFGSTIKKIDKNHYCLQKFLTDIIY